MAANLISYLTKVMHQDLTTAAKNVNCWSGITTSMPLLGAFIADAYAGRYLMIMVSSSVYIAVHTITTHVRFRGVN
ncbi:putative proton-dependent oligopeptide transporter family, MFS transporter superfamily [Helianthus debilis subsp. tardiflorus]